MMGRTIPVIILLLAGIVYWLYTPVPDELEQKVQFRQNYALMRIFQDVVIRAQTFFNGKPYYANIRNAIDGFLPDVQERREGSNIRATYTDFDGVKVLLYQPIERDPGLTPALIYIHGGGFTIGSTKLYHSLTLQFSEELNIVVASIEYRLAPEHPFPAAYDDCLTAVTWFLRHVDKFGVDSSRIGVAGDRAGGRATASLVQALRDETSLPKIKLQGLIYPSLQSLDNRSPSRQLYEKNFGNGGILNAKGSAIFTSVYLFGKEDAKFIEAMLTDNIVPLEFRKGDVRYSKYLNHDQIPDEMKNESLYQKPSLPDHVDEELWTRHKDLLLDTRYSGLLQHNLKNLPQAYILTCEHDTLRDDGIIYYKRLEEAGVPVVWKNYQAGYHGMINPTANYRVAKIAVFDFIEYLRKHL